MQNRNNKSTIARINTEKKLKQILAFIFEVHSYKTDGIRGWFTAYIIISFLMRYVSWHHVWCVRYVTESESRCVILRIVVGDGKKSEVVRRLS